MKGLAQARSLSSQHYELILLYSTSNSSLLDLQVFCTNVKADTRTCFRMNVKADED